MWVSWPSLNLLQLIFLKLGSVYYWVRKIELFEHTWLSRLSKYLYLETQSNHLCNTVMETCPSWWGRRLKSRNRPRGRTRIGWPKLAERPNGVGQTRVGRMESLFLEFLPQQARELIISPNSGNFAGLEPGGFSPTVAFHVNCVYLSLVFVV